MPPDIIDHYEPRFLGWLAFGWLVAFIGVLVLASVYEATLASRRRRAVRGSPVGQTDRRCRAMRADRRTVRIAVGAGLALPALAVRGEVLARPARDPSANRIRTERREID